MKKIVTFLMILVLLFSLTACTPGAQTSQEYEPFDPDKEYEIDFLGWGGVAEQSNFQYMINQFMKK